MGTSKFLIKTIIKSIEEYNKKLDVPQITVSVISDHINQKTNSETIEKIIYELAKWDSKYIAKILDFLLHVLDEDEKEIIIKSIHIDKDFFYFKDSVINKVKTNYLQLSDRDQYSYEIYLETQINEDKNYKNLDDFLIITLPNEWNIFYHSDTKYDKESPSIFGLSYTYHNQILSCYNKKANFSESVQQKIFIEALYENKNNAVHKKDLIDKWVKQPDETFKNIISKLKKQSPPNNFTSLEAKKLLRKITDGKDIFFLIYG